MKENTKNIFIAIFVVVSFITSISRGYAAQVNGSVYNENGPVIEANICVNQTSVCVTSTGSGQFSITNLNPGEYELTATHIGNKTSKIPISIVRDDTISVTLYMTRKITQLETVVVTGTRSPHLLKDAIIQTDLIRSEEIQQQGATRLSDVIQERVGLSVISDHGTGVQVQGLDPDYTLVLIDGEPVIGRTAGTLDLTRFSVGNLEQVEIVKGPTSSLYGSEALAGVINLITRKPQDPFSVSLSSQYGTHGSADLSGEAEIVEGPLGLYVFSNYNRSNGYDLNSQIPGPTTPQFTDVTINPRLTYQLFENLDFETSIRFNREDQNIDRFIQESGIVNRVESESEAEELSLTAKMRSNNGDSSSSIFKVYLSEFSTISKLINQDNSLRESSTFKQGYKKGELQYNINIGSNHALAVGAGYINESVRADRYTGVKQTSSNAFVFAQEQWKPNSRFHFMVSARADNHSDYAAHLSPRLSALISPKTWLNIRFSLGNGFKSPDFRQLYLNFTNPVVGYSVFGTSTVEESLSDLVNTGQIKKVLIEPSSEEIKPEESNSYNIGLEAQPWSFLRMSGNFFRNNVKNLIDSVPIAVKENNQRVFSYFNVNEVFTQGFEGELEFTGESGFEFGLGYQFLVAKDRDVIDQIKEGKIYVFDDDGSERALNTEDYGGLFNRSRHSGNIKASYYFKAIDTKTFIRGMWRGRYGDIMSDFNANQILDRDEEYLKGYTLWNFNIEKNWSSIDVNLGVENIFNKTEPSKLPSVPGRLVFTRMGKRF